MTHCIINVGGPIAKTAAGIARGVEAGFDLYEALYDDSPSSKTFSHKVKIGADLAIMTAEGLSLIANHVELSKNTRLKLSIAKGAADISQRMSFLACKINLKTNDYIDCGYGVVLRVTSVMRDTIELKPELFGDHLENVQFTATSMEFVCDGICFTKRVGIPLIKYLLHRTKPIDLSIILSKDDDKPAEIKVTAQEADDFKKALSANTIKDFGHIPELFENDPIFTQFKCPLTKKPIRYISVVKGTEHDPKPVYFEEKAIKDYLSKFPFKRPDMWPSMLEFNPINIMQAPAIQHQINNRLEEYLKDIKEAPIYSLQNPQTQNNFLNKFCQLAQNLGFHQVDQSEEQIADNIINKMYKKSALLVASVTVHTIHHDLEKGLITRKILILPIKTILKETDVLAKKELMNATFSLLGSQDNEHYQRLNKAFKQYSKVEITISTNLINPNIKWG